MCTSHTHGVCRHFPELFVVHQQQGRSRVEAEPSKPQNHCSQQLQRDRVTWKGYWSFQGVSLGVIKASPPGPQHERRIQGCQPTVQMDNAATRKVQDSHVHKGIIVGSAQKAALAPHRVGNYGINESRQGDAVEQVGRHLAALGERSGHNGDTGSAKRVLEEPKSRIGPNARKFCRTNKGFSRSRLRIGLVATKSKGEAWFWMGKNGVEKEEKRALAAICGMQAP